MYVGRGRTHPSCCIGASLQQFLYPGVLPKLKFQPSYYVGTLLLVFDFWPRWSEFNPVTFLIAFLGIGARFYAFWACTPSRLLFLSLSFVTMLCGLIRPMTNLKEGLVTPACLHCVVIGCSLKVQRYPVTVFTEVHDPNVSDWLVAAFRHTVGSVCDRSPCVLDVREPYPLLRQLGWDRHLNVSVSYWIIEDHTVISTQ